MIEPRYLLDTNICIYLVEALNYTVAERIVAVLAASLTISIVSYAEIRRNAAAWDDGVKLGYRALFDKVAVLPFDVRCAEAYATLPFKRHAFDRLIGAHAKSIGAILVTANAYDFSDIEGLVLEDWTK